MAPCLSSDRPSNSVSIAFPRKPRKTRGRKTRKPGKPGGNPGTKPGETRGKLGDGGNSGTDGTFSDILRQWRDQFYPANTVNVLSVPVFTCTDVAILGMMTRKRGPGIQKGSKADIHRQAFATIQEHLYWYGGGVSMVSKKTGFLDVGTVTAVRWGDRTFLLTADHVVKESLNDELTFIFRPHGTIPEARWWQRSTPGPLFRAQPLRVVQRYRCAEDDLAALEVNPDLEASGRVRFYDLDVGSKVIRPIRSSLFAIGLPFDSCEHLGPRAAPFTMHFLAGDEVRKNLPNGFNLTKNILMQFPPAKDKREPGGFSGSGAWYQRATPKRQIWRPEMILAGIITHYRRSRQVLEICRVERVVKFFQRICPRGWHQQRQLGKLRNSGNSGTDGTFSDILRRWRGQSYPADMVNVSSVPSFPSPVSQAYRVLGWRVAKTLNRRVTPFADLAKGGGLTLFRSFPSTPFRRTTPCALYPFVFFLLQPFRSKPLLFLILVLTF